jgi:tetratricopeptide (TPR) repeat protein
MPLPRFRPRRTPRRLEAGARRWLARAAVVLALFALGACGSAPSPAPPQEPERLPQAEPFAPQEQAYLVDPLTGYPREVDAGRQERLRDAWRALVKASARDEALETAAGLLEEDPSFVPAQVLAAEVELGEGEFVRVIERLLPVMDQMPQYVAGQLVLGRAAEQAGDIPLAYSAFREIAARNPRAFQRVGELHPRAVEIVSNRLREAVRQSRLDEAETHLALLRRWAPDEIGTLEGARDLAVARGDRKAELAAVQGLSARRPGDRALTEHRAELELAVGDPSAGLQIIQTLVSEHPKDPALQEKLAAAKFRWRVSLLPKGVQDVAAKTELNRADLAVLLYWLIPSVRYARPSVGRIATDILDHPHQEEIVRVVNLGLMDVDSTLHRFSPGSPARRSTALRSLALVLARSGETVSCLGPAAKGYPSTPAVCDAAAACGLLAPTPPDNECRPSAALGGGEAVEIIRRTLKLLGSS